MLSCSVVCRALGGMLSVIVVERACSGVGRVRVFVGPRRHGEYAILGGVSGLRWWTRSRVGITSLRLVDGEGLDDSANSVRHKLRVSVGGKLSLSEGPGGLMPVGHGIFKLDLLRIDTFHLPC